VYAPPYLVLLRLNQRVSVETDGLGLSGVRELVESMQCDKRGTEPEIVFVNYLSRSGSTLLCKLLDRYKGISVGIEAGFPGAITKLIPDEYREINEDGLLARYLDELYQDVRFRDWKVDQQRLFSRLRRTGYPLTFRDILLACLEEYFGHGRVEIYIHKAGFYIDILDDVRSIFGDCVKNIFIIRDPRAIYSSQNNATCIYSGRLMGSCLANFVYQYKKRVQIVKADKSNTLLCIKYEDLVKDTDQVMEKVLSFLGIPHAELEDGDYADRIPDGQKQLHVNVGDAPNINSFDKWKAKLRAHEVLFIQRKLSSEMRSLGYKPVCVDGLSATGFFLYMILELKYIYTRILRFARFV